VQGIANKYVTYKNSESAKNADPEVAELILNIKETTAGVIAYRCKIAALNKVKHTFYWTRRGRTEAITSANKVEPEALEYFRQLIEE
jgi:hypothetical protein